MKLTIQHHLGNPNMCRIPELTIRPIAECEGGGWWMPKEQAERIVSACAFEDRCVAEGWDRAISSGASPSPNMNATATKHTAGPWEAIDSDEPQLANFHSAIYGPAGEYDALFVAMANQNGRSPADARLIAAAPDMLAALKDVEAVGMLNPTGSRAVEAAKHVVRTAIAKATA